MRRLYKAFRCWHSLFAPTRNGSGADRILCEKVVAVAVEHSHFPSACRRTAAPVILPLTAFRTLRMSIYRSQLDLQREESFQAPEECGGVFPLFGSLISA